MPAVVVVGAQWGDEGKGKIVDLLAEQADFVVRYSGGNNAGHSVVNDYGSFKLHLVPSGIFHKDCVCIIGNGVVVTPQALLEELEELGRGGVPTDHLFISERAHLVMPYHILLDGLEEQARGGGAIGTTLRGIGPAYMDKAGRLGIRAGDLLDKDSLYKRLSFVLEQKNAIITKVYNASPFSLDKVYEELLREGERLAPYIAPVEVMVQEGLDSEKVVLLEGAQGTMLDLDYGTYPYVTSSYPAAGGACVGAGIPPRSISQILGVFKAYTTRVGGGPFPSELNDEVGELIRARGNEYGTTTGRARRCGWFDAVAASYSTRINGMTGVALTRLDVLDTLPIIKACVAYRTGEGPSMKDFPASASVLERCVPVLEEMPGWQANTSEIRRFEDLPREAVRYIKALEEMIQCPISLISVGERREQVIVREPFW